MSEKQRQHDDELSHAIAPAAPSAPGRAPASARIAARPQVVFRVESAEAAAVFADRFGPRDGNGVAAAADVAVHRAASSSSGHALPGDVRARFESSTGADLSNVRVHTGAESAAAASAVGARAYTVGNDIHFGEGQYAPADPFGIHLLAHEVAHTVQQSGGAQRMQKKLEVSTPGDAAEVEADRAADAMVSGAPAMISGASAGLERVVMRETKHDLTSDERSRLANAGQLIEKAQGNKTAALGALSGYAGAAPGLLSSLKSTFDGNLKVYKAQFDKVNGIIAKAKEVAKIRDEVIGEIVGEALGGIGTVIGAVSEEAKETYDRIKEGSSELKEWLGGAFKNAGAGEGGGGGGGGMAPPWAKELDFYKQYSQLSGNANALLQVSVAVAKLAGPMAKVEEAIKGTLDAGKSRSDYPVLKLETDAAKLESGSRALGGAAPGVTTLLTQLQGASAQAKAAAPQTDVEIEKELWIKWAATLPRDKTDELDLHEVEQHLKALGIWGQLGIDPSGGWFKDDEQAVAVCSAYAQTQVLAHKGVAVDVTLIDGRAVDAVELPGLPPLAADTEGNSKVQGQDAPSKKVKAVVIGARASKSIGTDVLKKTSKTREAIAEYLLRHAYITVILRPFEVPPLNPDDQKDDGDPTERHGTSDNAPATSP